MPVLSVSTPRANVQNLALSAMKHGVAVEPVENEGDTFYIDLTGREDKIIAVANDSGAEYVCETDAVPHEDPVYTMTGRKGMDE